MKIGDYIVLAISLLLVLTYGVFQYTYQEAGKYAEISIGQETVKKVPLNENKNYTLEGTSLTVSVCDGEIYVSASGCADHLCVKSGKISLVGKSIVCLPQRVIIRIVGDLDVDAVSGEAIG